MNPAHARFYGYDSPEELIGKSWRLLYDEEELIRFEREIMPEFIRKGNFRGVTRGKKKDGSTYPQEISLTALEDGGLICIVRDITEQKNIEDALRESEERFRTLAAYIQDPVLILDFDGSVQYANNAAFRFVGIPPSLDVSSENIATFIAPESQEKALADLEKVRVSGGPLIAEYRMRTAQGEIKWVEAVGTRVSWNKTDRDLVALRDITSRKQAEEELRLKDNAIESSINAIAIGDLSGNLTYVNPAFLSIWGYEDRNEVLGRSAISFWIVEDEAQQVFEEIHATGKWSGQMTGRKKDGTSIQVQLSGNLIRGASGEPVAMMSSFIDITDQKRIEKALRQSEQKFRSMVEASPDIIWETDTRGNFTYVSPQSSQQSGYPPEELIGSPLLKLVSPESLDAMHKIFLSIIQDKSSFITFEIPAVHRNGSVVVLEIRSVIINDEDGQVIGLRGIARDITERRKAEESLQLANRKLHLLSSITRHDINNQLSIMRGYCKLLETKMHDPAFSGYFEKVNASSERISSIIRFTREYEDLGVKTSAWQDIWQLLEPATRDLGLGHIRLINDLPPVWRVLADPLIVRVFFNLVDNAVRYGGKITTIRFSVKESGEDQVIVCENDGESIPYDEKEKIFERGFGKNTGFGLFLIREILAITHITIKETGEPGKGARFEMMVPRGNYRFGDITDVRDSIKDE